MNHAVNGITAQYAWKVASVGALGFSSLVFGFMLGQKDFIARAPRFPTVKDFVPTQELRLEPTWLTRSSFDFSFDETDAKDLESLAITVPEVRVLTLPRATKIPASRPVIARRSIPVPKIADPVIVESPISKPKILVPLPQVAAKIRSDFLVAIAAVQKRRSPEEPMYAAVSIPAREAEPAKAVVLESQPLPQILESKPLSIRAKIDEYPPPVVLSSAQIPMERVLPLPEVKPEPVSAKVLAVEEVKEEPSEESVPFNKEEFALALASEAISNPTPERIVAIEEFVAREEDRSVASEVLPAPKVYPAEAAQIIDVTPISIAKIIPKAEPVAALPVVVASTASPQTIQSVRTTTTQNAVIAATSKSAVASVTPANIDAALARIQDVSADAAASMETPADSQNYCGLTTHKFKLSANPDTLDSHPCVAPEWIAKTYSGSAGWIRIRPEGLMPTLFSGNVKEQAILLMDSNSIAMLALKVGSRLVAGTGHIVGLLPDGYKVKVSGKAEDTDTFTYRGSRYFSAVNIAPGANVLLIEKSGEATVPLFAPVLQDSITFLDASKIEKIDLKIQVQKLGSQAAEIQSVPVRHAMFDAISTLTNSQGVASLSGVPIVPGYPLYLDVRSKQKDRWGPTYRFEVAAKSGISAVYMPSDEQLQGWISQGADFRPDSGWVLGAVSKDRLDGYRRYSFAKVQPLERETPVDPTTFSIGHDGKLGVSVPLEGDAPRFLGTRVPGGLAITSVVREDGVLLQSRLLPISPLVIHVVAPPTF